MMPWKRKGKCVFKVSKSGNIGKKQGCSDSAKKAEKYLKALYANSGDVSEEIMRYLEDLIRDNTIAEWFDSQTLEEVLDENVPAIWEDQ